eukprot:Platyproteum_vivax@DN14596_c0_g1_i1.p1
MSSENLKVAVCLRSVPSNSNSNSNSNNSYVKVDCENSTISLRKLKYDFSGVFENSKTQGEVYLQTLHNLVKSVLLGYNCSTITWGEANTGKTFTLYGSDSTFDIGIVHLAIQHLFDTISHIRESKPESHFLVYMSSIEVSNNKIRDLLVDSADIPPTSNGPTPPYKSVLSKSLTPNTSFPFYN